MKPEDFEMMETLDREALRRHPLWTPFRSGDRPWILGWGVPGERLDAELERFTYCGPQPLVPILETERVPDRPDVMVAATITLADGQTLQGYVLAPLVVGVFAGDHEFVFNRGLPSHARRTADALAAELGVAEDTIFPLCFCSWVPGPEDRPLEGEFARPG